jgi:hypothetical protein
MAAKCNWDANDDDILLRVLRAEKEKGNQADSGWKKVVWTAAAAALEASGSKKGGKKTAIKCHHHFGNVSDCLSCVHAHL